MQQSPMDEGRHRFLQLHLQHRYMGTTIVKFLCADPRAVHGDHTCQLHTRDCQFRRNRRRTVRVRVHRELQLDVQQRKLESAVTQHLPTSSRGPGVSGLGSSRYILFSSSAVQHTQNRSDWRRCGWPGLHPTLWEIASWGARSYHLHQRRSWRRFGCVRFVRFKFVWARSERCVHRKWRHRRYRKRRQHE